MNQCSSKSRTKTIFFDVGGVCLTNGWNEEARRKAETLFALDAGEMERRHRPLLEGFERGEISLNEYLDQVIFHKKRPFSRAEFFQFMKDASTPHETTFETLQRLKGESRYLLATLNNESLELNRYRIEEFGLGNYFTVFFSSCFLGVRKPAPRIFQMALQVTQCSAGECLFIDDREENVRAAEALGMRIIWLKEVEKLAEELKAHGISMEQV